MSRTSLQVQLCQIPRSLCRMAVRAPNMRALRTSNLGNVSAPAAAFSATALPSRAAALARAQLRPLAVLRRRSYCLDMKTPPEGGQVAGGNQLVVVAG